MDVTESTLKDRALTVGKVKIQLPLLLLAKTLNEIIQCHLHLTLSKDGPVYEALSYLQGDLDIRWICEAYFEIYGSKLM